MGVWGSLVAFQVWDLTTPVQIRALPYIITWQQKQKKQNHPEDSEQGMVKQLEVD